jgi:hypothetical protein
VPHVLPSHPAHVLPSPRLRFSGGMRAVGSVTALVLRLLPLSHVVRLLPLRVLEAVGST